MEVRKTEERPTEEQSKPSINSKSDSNEDPNQKPPHISYLISHIDVRINADQ